MILETPAAAPDLLHTVLLPQHIEMGARIVPFAGWQMPVQYAGVKAEALAVREKCGVFDVSHMGQLDFEGEGITEALNAIISADWSKIPVGRAAYALLLNARAGVEDDIMGYRLAPNHWLVVVNASRAEADEAHFRAHLSPEFFPRSRAANQAMLAIQGPQALEILQPFCDWDLSSLKWRDVATTQVLGAPCVLTRGGYTGSDGIEWMGDALVAPLLWRKLVEAGAAPCGLGARDVLRLEAGLPLYGHELRADWTPDESGCAFAVGREKTAFIGREALLEKRNDDLKWRIRGLKMSGKAIAREGYAVFCQGEILRGEITSGTLSPTLETPIALARVPAHWPLDSQVEVEIRGQKHAAILCPTPFIAPARKGQ